MNKARTNNKKHLIYDQNEPEADGDSGSRKKRTW